MNERAQRRQMEQVRATLGRLRQRGGYMPVRLPRGSAGARPGTWFEVNLEVVCGLSGDQNTTCSYSYVATDLSGNILNTLNETGVNTPIDCDDGSGTQFVVLPGQPIPMEPLYRLIDCKKEAATTGVGFYDNDNVFWLVLAHEAEAMGVAPVVTCS